jgi:hypothetical protein
MLELARCDSDSAAHFRNQQLPLCLPALRSCLPVVAEQPDEAEEVGRFQVLNEKNEKKMS